MSGKETTGRTMIGRPSGAKRAERYRAGLVTRKARYDFSSLSTFRCEAGMPFGSYSVSCLILKSKLCAAG